MHRVRREGRKTGSMANGWRQAKCWVERTRNRSRVGEGRRPTIATEESIGVWEGRRQRDGEGARICEGEGESECKR